MRAAAACADVFMWWQPKDWHDRSLIDGLRKKHPKMKTVSWSVDDPHILETGPPEIWEGFEFGATCCRGSFAWYEAHGIVPILAYTPCDPDRHGKAVADEGQRCDISFASTNVYSKHRWPHVFASRKQMIITVADLGKTYLYGAWDKSSTSWGGSEGLPDEYKAGWRGIKTGQQTPGIFAATRVNLSSSVRPDAYQYVNRRVIECMASGGFMLSDRTNGFGDMVEEGVEVECWSTLEELRSKTKYYLAHEDVRARIAEAGRRKSLDLFGNERLARHVLAEVGLG